MADQFDVIEAGGRGRRPIWLLVVLVLLGASVVGLIASRGDEPSPRPEPARDAAPIQSLTRIESDPNLLRPEVREKGGVARMDVVFPDGVRATVRYPAELRLDRLGLRPFQGMWVDGHYRQLVAPYNGEVEITKGGEPIRSFADNVTLWPRQAGSGSYGPVLLFAFGRWRMAMYDRPPGLDFGQRMMVAEELRGRVTEDGFLVLTGSDRVRLAEPGEAERGDVERGDVERGDVERGDAARGAPVGPQLWFGGGATDMVVLMPSPGCEDPRTRDDPVEGVCRDGVRVSAIGDDEFVGKALDGIRIDVK